MKTYQIRVGYGQTIDTTNGHLFKIGGYLFGAAKMHGRWNVTELSTGTAMTYGSSTMKEAMEIAYEVIKRSSKQIDYAIEVNINKFGRLNEDITPDMCREYVS